MEVFCVLVDQVEDTYKWDNVLHCEESKRVNSVGFCRPRQVFLSLGEARIKTSEFSVPSCRASLCATGGDWKFTSFDSCLSKAQKHELRVTESDSLHKFWLLPVEDIISRVCVLHLINQDTRHGHEHVCGFLCIPIRRWHNCGHGVSNKMLAMKQCLSKI